MADEMNFIDPTAGGDEAKILRAPRPMDLAGKVVGLLDNTKEQADIILATLGEALRERHGVASLDDATAALPCLSAQSVCFDRLRQRRSAAHFERRRMA